MGKCRSEYASTGCSGQLASSLPACPRCRKLSWSARPQALPAWSLVLPKNSMFYRMPSTAAVAGQPPAYLTALAGPQDFVIDLKAYQRKVHSILD